NSNQAFNVSRRRSTVRAARKAAVFRTLTSAPLAGSLMRFERSSICLEICSKVEAAADGSSGSTRWRAPFSSMMGGRERDQIRDLFGTLPVQIELANLVVQLVAEEEVIDAPLLRQAVELDLLDCGPPGFVELAHDPLGGGRERHIVEPSEALQIARVSFQQGPEIGRRRALPWPNDLARIRRLVGRGWRTASWLGAGERGCREQGGDGSGGLCIHRLPL